jgi:hypothetical protein
MIMNADSIMYTREQKEEEEETQDTYPFLSTIQILAAE